MVWHLLHNFNNRKNVRHVKKLLFNIDEVVKKVFVKWRDVSFYYIVLNTVLSHLLWIYIHQIKKFEKLSQLVCSWHAIVLFWELPNTNNDCPMRRKQSSMRVGVVSSPLPYVSINDCEQLLKLHKLAMPQLLPYLDVKF